MENNTDNYRCFVLRVRPHHIHMCWCLMQQSTANIEQKGILYGRLLIQSKDYISSSNAKHISVFFCDEQRSVCLSLTGQNCNESMLTFISNQLISFELNSVWCTLSLSKQEDGASKLQNIKTISVIFEREWIYNTPFSLLNISLQSSLFGLNKLF